MFELFLDTIVVLFILGLISTPSSASQQTTSDLETLESFLTAQALDDELLDNFLASADEGLEELCRKVSTQKKKDIYGQVPIMPFDLRQTVESFEKLPLSPKDADRYAKSGKQYAKAISPSRPPKSA